MAWRRGLVLGRSGMQAPGIIHRSASLLGGSNLVERIAGIG